MSRTGVFIVCAVVVALSAITILATDSIGDRQTAEPPTTTAAVTTTSVADTTTSTSTTTTTTTTTTTLPPAVVAIDALLAELGVEDKARQLVVFGASGSDPAGSISVALGDVCVGGIFVTKNAGNWSPADSLTAATEAITAMSDAASACVAPPFITTDAEAGSRVLKVPVAPLPAPATLEANHLADPATTSEGLAPAAEAFAAELAAAGVHVNLGVIADVDVGDGYYMDRQGRSFGGDPTIVTAITDAIVEGHCRSGVAPTLKHFPNQGSTVEDPHQRDSFSTNDADAWRQFGARPYEHTRAPLVMTGHIRYEGIDDQRPATLSGVLTGWLRDDLGYGGVIITDDLHSMRGVTDEFPPAVRGVAAIEAGADLALYVATDDAEAVVAAIVDRADADPAFAARVDESVTRVLRLKGALGLLPWADQAWFELCSAPSAE